MKRKKPRKQVFFFIKELELLDHAHLLTGICKGQFQKDRKKDRARESEREREIVKKDRDR